MPREIRKLVFDAREIETAIGVYLDSSKAVAKSKHIVSVALQSGGEIGALIKLSIAIPGGRDEIILRTEQLGAAFILYCKKTGVPLPKGGRKMLSREDNSIVMEIAVG